MTSVLPFGSPPDDEKIELKGRAWNALMAKLAEHDAKLREVVARLDRFRLEFRRTFTARLVNKQVVDVVDPSGTYRFVLYAWRQQHQLSFHAFGETTVEGNDGLSSDEFVYPAFNLSEAHLHAEQHTGLYVGEEDGDPTQRIVQITAFHNRDTGEPVFFFNASLPDFFRVLVEQVGGEAGDQNGPATFTYKITDLDGDVLADSETSPVAPLRPRPPLGAMIAPPTGAMGVATWDWVERRIKLWDPGEVPDPQC